MRSRLLSAAMVFLAAVARLGVRGLAPGRMVPGRVLRGAKSRAGAKKAAAPRKPRASRKLAASATASEAEIAEMRAKETEPIPVQLGDEMELSFMKYAMSTILGRALPDMRDGLKPVHRRILYAMRELDLRPNSRYRKCARVVGEVLGKFHPHGDNSVYDALVRLAQDFVMSERLVDGHGNFGSVDADPAAAMRYTECKLTAFASDALLNADDLGKSNRDLPLDGGISVQLADNFDSSEQEPRVLPARLPVLLINGATGIAVGMATNIPPHNLEELIGACLHLIKTPDARDETLLNYIPGPDFPTGGVIVEPKENIAEAYRSGKGGFRLRCKYEVEDLGRGQWQVIITEIPYQVQKSRLIEKLAEIIDLKKVPILADVRDESAEDIRIVLEPKSKNVDVEVLMGMLYRNSELETRFSLNMNVLIDGLTPKVCSLKEVLRAFLDHRRDVLLRRSTHRMVKIDHRLEVLEGFIIAFLNLDRVIDIIRYDDSPKIALMTEDWGKAHVRAMDEADYVAPLKGSEMGLTEVQSEAILNMRLRSLRRLEEIELVKERDALMLERVGLEDLLDSEDMQWKTVAEQLRETRSLFGSKSKGGARRTAFAVAGVVEDVPLEAMIDKEPVTVVCSKMGWIRAMTGHIDLARELKFKDGDEGRFVFHAQTTDRLLVFGSNGRFYTLGASVLPGGRGMGEPLRLMVDLPNEAEIVALFIHRVGNKLLVASSAGDGFVVSEDDVVAQTRAGKQVLNVRGEVRAKVCSTIAGDYVACVGENRKVILFPLDELPEMGRGKGVRLQKYKDGGLSDATTFKLSDGLSWLDPAGRTRTQTELSEWAAKRAGAGRMAPRGFPRNNRFT